MRPLLPLVSILSGAEEGGKWHWQGLFELACE